MKSTEFNPIRVAIIEDHPVYRDGLASVLIGCGIEVAGTAGSVAEAHDLLRAEAVDVVLLDLGLPDGTGLDVLGTLQQRHPHLAVVVLTMYDDRTAVLDAIRAGARGYLLKGAGQGEIVDAVRRAAAGGAVFQAGPADVVLSAARSQTLDPAAALGLTPREAAVLRLVADGLTNEAIAQRLGIARKTVRNQVSSVLSKLNVDNRRAAAERARAVGL